MRIQLGGHSLSLRRMVSDAEIEHPSTCPHPKPRTRTFRHVRVAAHTLWRRRGKMNSYRSKIFHAFPAFGVKCSRPVSNRSIN